MEPSMRRRPERPRGWLLGTVLVLVLAFIVVIGLFFVFSSLSPLFVGKCVAVVEISEPLTIEGVPPSLFSVGSPGSEQIATTIEGLDKREDVGAVLIVFNSPGGSIVATREIYAAVKGLDKPSVSYFRETAASGAYYVASGTDYIISDPDAITGSIGVIATFTEMSGLLEKLGVNVTEITSGQYKDMGSSFRNMTPEERTMLQELVDEVYREFRDTVVENRRGRLDMAKFDEVADGRILTGRQAERVGLVDETGSKKDAIMKAAELANISAASAGEVRLCPVSTMAEEGGLFSVESLMRGLQASSGFSLDYR